MAFNTPKTPIVVNSDIESAYVQLNPSDILYTNFYTSRNFSITALDTLNSSACSLTAAVTGSFSGHYNNAQMTLFNRGFYNSYSGLTSLYIGIFSLKKRFYDTGFQKGSLTATVTGDFAGDYIDSGSGQLLQKSTSATVGCVLVDDGMFVVTAAGSANLTLAITSISYSSKVNHTGLNVFCRCPHDEQNYSLNPTFFNSGRVGNWMSDPLTSSTTAAEFAPFLVSSGLDFSPIISSVGLYNQEGELLAISKLAQPIKKLNFTSTSVILQLDL